MIYRFILSLLVAVMAIFPATAETLSASKCFVEAPESVIPLLQKNTRLDMLDYFNAGSDKASQNIVGMDARVLALSDSMVTYQASDGIICSIFVVNPDAPSPIIGLIESVPLPAPDTRISFFNSRWEAVDVMDEPGIKEWLDPQFRKDRGSVERALPFMLIEYVYDPATQTVTAENTLSQFYVSTDRPDELSKLRTRLVYKWNGKQFKLRK